METKTYMTIDRTALGWPAGPWDGEPDKMQWPDVLTGLPCLAVRHPSYGHWCGYVGLPPEHLMYGKGYNDVDFEAHGGLTFAESCSPGGDEAKGVCHIPAPGESDHVWWLGFDCGHTIDFSPHDVKDQAVRGYPFMVETNRQYRTLAYVRQQCASLASQVATVEKRE